MIGTLFGWFCFGAGGKAVFRAGLENEEALVLESRARRDAESILRDARLTANEEAL